MLTVGFDPSFVDTLVRVENMDGSLSKNLPLPGHHHRSPTITRIAGGNGVNVSAMLTSMDIDHRLVVPCDEEFQILLNNRNIKFIEKIQCKVNNSVGVTWSDGEMQFNDARYGPLKEHWNESVHNLWVKSPLHIYLNWGLNPNSLEWVSIQWLATCGWNYDEITEEHDVINQALKTDSPRNSILLEPGSIKSHKERAKLNLLLDHIAKISHDVEYAIFSSNEEEYDEYRSVEMKQYILHTSKIVTLKQKAEENQFDVPRLNKEPLTFVGAGDAFIAGIIKSIIIDNILDPITGIQIAQEFLHGNL